MRQICQERRQRPGKKTKEAKDVKRRFTGKCYISAGGKILWWSRGNGSVLGGKCDRTIKGKTIAGRKKWVIQRPASELGKDVRVYAIGNRIVQAMLRVSETDFRSNFCLGGQAELYELGAEEQYMVQKNSGRIKNRLCGN